MRWLVIAGLVALSGFVHATSVDAAYARRLMRAKTTAEADRLRARFESTEVARLSCRLQLERGLAPLSCYEFVALEREWGVGSRATRRATQIGLDHRCVRAAAGLKVQTAEGSLRHVSAVCAARVREVRAIRAYRADDAGWSGD